MRRMLLVLTLTVFLSVAMVVGGGLSAVAQDDPKAPDAPQCDWYFASVGGDEWWEYWCWWPGWGWEFVFWVWA